VPKYLIYSRQKNRKFGIVLFRGEPIWALDEAMALAKASQKDPKLRPSRLFAVLVKAEVPAERAKIEVELPGGVEGLTPTEMKHALGGSDV
jgi:hypothetical protein